MSQVDLTTFVTLINVKITKYKVCLIDFLFICLILKSILNRTMYLKWKRIIRQQRRQVRRHIKHITTIRIKPHQMGKIY